MTLDHAKLDTGSSPTAKTSAVRMVSNLRNRRGNVYFTVRTAFSSAGEMSSGRVGKPRSGSLMICEGEGSGRHRAQTTRETQERGERRGEERDARRRRWRVFRGPDGRASRPGSGEEDVTRTWKMPRPSRNP